MTELLADLVGIISGTLPGATERDKAFAQDLVHGTYGFYKRGYLTENQGKAAFRMIERLKKGPPPADQAPAMATVYSFLLNAKKHLKYPKLMLSMGRRHLKVYMSGARSKHPDTINLVTEDEFGSMDLWLGRVFPNGEWQHRDVAPALHAEVSGLLTKLAEDPVAVARESGHLSGNCCFCNRKLTDEGEGRSVEIGYGPVCAQKWGLPWG